MGEVFVLLIIMAIWALIPEKENKKISKFEKEINEHLKD